MIQIVPHYNKKERDSLEKALKSINEKTKAGFFTTKALGFQKNITVQSASLKNFGS